MLKLKEANIEDIEKEYAYMSDIPSDENGFTNPDAGCSFEEYRDRVIPRLMDHAKGLNLPQNYVPCTEYFLWDDDEIVGLFRLRHHLNEFLANGPGHIGYGIGKQYRNKGYGSKGLALMIEKAWTIIPEDEIYLSCCITNPASLKVQLNNGAYVHHRDETHNYTRIPRKR